MHKHSYSAKIVWTGNIDNGTKSYQSYERSHTIHIKHKVDLLCSSDPAFRGEAHKHNPEDLLLSSVASCHMLWYLHLCAEAGVIVLDYEDEAIGTMEIESNGSGRFTDICLHPRVIVADKNMEDTALTLHKKANELCFIANSLNFKIKHKAVCSILF